MRKLWIVLIVGLLLTGCSEKETYETISDEVVIPAAVIPKQIYMELPEESILPAMECDNGMIYFCREFEVSVQTMESGDIQKTIQSVSGFVPERLTVVKTQDPEISRYEFVWSTAGELGEQLSRSAVLDDGDYHYILTATTSADLAKEYNEVWNGLFESFRIY